MEEHEASTEKKRRYAGEDLAGPLAAHVRADSKQRAGAGPSVA